MCSEAQPRKKGVRVADATARRDDGDGVLRVDEGVPKPKLDTADAYLLSEPKFLTDTQQQNYDALAAQLMAILLSQRECPGDGNIDFVVNQKDLKGWRFYSESSDLSSVYDLNLDGVTDDLDRAIIEQSLKTKCLQ